MGTLANGHMSSVECLERISLYSDNRDNDVLLSGDWSGTICGWNMTDVCSNSQSTAEASSKKKRKGNTSAAVSAQQYRPMFMMKAHTQCVTGIAKSKDHSGKRIFTSSWDHSIKEWDMDRRDCVSTRVGSTVMTSIDCTSGDSSSLLLATSHPDGKVRLWDVRVKDEAGNLGGSSAAFATLGKTTNWTSEVRWKPNSDSKVLVSSDYTGSVTLWDVRTTVPLGRIEAHTGKALCCDWLSQPEDGNSNSNSGGGGCKVISGGSDSHIVTTGVHQ
jgi:ribosome biogenesis protein YTM1